ncbi:MAG: DUF2304 domain-containing protein [Solirubrobacterales bacterium]
MIFAVEGLSSRLQAVAIIVTVLLLVFVFELVRRRKLQERYSLLWLAAAIVLLLLAVFSDLLSELSSAIGVSTPSNALFAVAIGFLVLLVLHFSTTISRLTDESKVLAQRVAIAEERLHQLDGGESLEQQVPAPERESQPS